MGPSLGQADLCDGGPTPITGLASPTIDLELVLVTAFLAKAILVGPDRRSPCLDSSRQHLDYPLVDALDRFRGKIFA